MAIGSKIEQRNHIVGFREEIDKAAAESQDRFATWFDDAKDANAAYVRGAWDFQYHIATPLVGLLQMPEDKTILEIGYGGGRLLAAASRCFNQAVGVDIHGHASKVEEILNSRGVQNIRLLQSSGDHVPVPDQSIDVVYSFIVLQHVEKYAIFRNYLEEAFRILKPGGLAVLYFARWCWLSHLHSNKWRYALDCVLERLAMPCGYKEIPERVNCINLLISKPHAKALARKIGFQIKRELVSRRRVPDQGHLFGAQNGLVLEKTS